MWLPLPRLAGVAALQLMAFILRVTAYAIDQIDSLIEPKEYRRRPLFISARHRQAARFDGLLNISSMLVDLYGDLLPVMCWCAVKKLLIVAAICYCWELL